MIHAYSKPLALGHGYTLPLWNGSSVVVQEKIDGSQFSFGVDAEGKLHCRSRGAALQLETPQKLFAPAVATAQKLARTGKLLPGHVYRAEAVCQKRHNVQEYHRAPEAGMILFDVETAPSLFLHAADLFLESRRLNLELAPVFDHVTAPPTRDQLDAWLSKESLLGGPVEGVVLKNYSVLAPDGRVLMAKYVSEKFKEVKGEDRKATPAFIVEQLIETYRTEARWAKAVQHLEEAGALVHEPRDIAQLVREVPRDLLGEEAGVIRDRLFAHFWPQIQRGVIAGLPEWYKRRLMEEQCLTMVS